MDKMSQNNDSSKLEVIRPALPKGGGAIQGMGETFQADEFTGTASLNIPFTATACRGTEPGLSVNYSSGSGNGIAGLGFQIGLPSISRQTSKGIPKYDDSDTFLFSGADYLVPDENQPPREEQLNGIKYLVKRYRPRVEGGFARIEHWTNSKEGSFWKVHAADNSQSIFGKNASARISDPEQPQRIFEWLLEETLDAHSNATLYSYKKENTENVSDSVSEINRDHSANRYLERIRYGNAQPLDSLTQLQPFGDAMLWHFEVVMDYGEYDLSETNSNPYVPVRAWEARPDPFSNYRAGFEQRTLRLCRNILMFHRFPNELGADPLLVHALKLEYHLSPVASQLRQVQHIGYMKVKGKYVNKTLPPLLFSFTGFNPEGRSFQTFAEENGDALPGVSDGGHYTFTDLYGEGIAGILYADGQSLYYREAKGSGIDSRALYGPWKEVLSFPIDRQINGPSYSLVDFTGNGRLDLLVSNDVYTGYYETNAHNQWTGFYPLESLPVTYRDSLNQHSDMTGDGLSDIVRIEKDHVVVYPALRAKGFDQAILENRQETLPLSKPSSPKEFLGFDDLLGAGQPQLVRIREGIVECWPSLGYGRFGKPVSLKNAPFFSGDFDSSRLRLADLDGSGPADLIYIHSDHVQIFFNQSGNSFSDPIRIDLPEAWDNLSQIQLADVLGNGTHSLVFTKVNPKPQHWFYDFCQARKPYLLCETDNQMGAKHEIHYCASTQFYLKDKRNGKPWSTRLPFPVQVIAGSESIDHISKTRLTSEYNYRHGYYDDVEREFRGFGCVERLDTDTYTDILAAQKKNTDLENLESNYYVPPVLSKTWYHPGAWLEGKDIREHFKPEFFNLDTAAKNFPNDEININEQKDTATKHEAYRALKGQVLRTELYGLDGTQWAQNPYIVNESQHHVRLLQPRGNNRYAVFLLHQRESIAYQYERNPADPMVSQDFALELDNYGHVVRSCHIAYPRRGAGLPQQKKLHTITQQSGLAHLDSSQTNYLLAVPVETKSHELHELQTESSGYFSFVSLQQQVEIALPGATLLSWQRSYYYDPNTAQLLPLGQFTPQALHARTETVELDIAHTCEVFQNILTAPALEQLLTGKDADKGAFIKYEQSPENKFYWNPGPLQQYSNQNLFYLPVRFTDPYGHVTEYTYDAYRMNVIKVRDPLGNEIHIEDIDYRLMVPMCIRDANGQVSKVRNDALGMVTVTAHHGYEGVARKGFPDLSIYEPLAEPQSAEEVLAAPEIYLQSAATFFYYDAWSWQLRKEPVYALSLSAEKYPEELEATEHITISIGYNDGFGRDLQHKLRVRESGEARVLNEDGSIETIEVAIRWLTSGATRYNNKGKPIQQYEPFYSGTWKYIAHNDYNTVGVSSTLYYDPLERVVRTELPKAKDKEGKLMTLFTKVEWGEIIPSPWAEIHFDANDTIKDSVYYQRIFDEEGEVRPDSPIDDEHELNSLRKAVVFYHTPNKSEVDNLGRAIKIVQQLKESNEIETEFLTTCNELDTLGNVLTSADPRLSVQNKHNLQIEYAMNKQSIRTVSVDAGTHWQLTNVAGKPIFSCDALGTRLRYQHDELQRPLKVWMQANAASPEQCVQALLYGDSRYTDETGQSLPYFQTPEKWNCLGLPVVHLDEAGFKISAHFSISGQPLAGGMQITKSYKEEVNWSIANTILWKELVQNIEQLLQPEELPALKVPKPLADLLEAQLFTTHTKYDALGRVAEAKDPGGNISRPEYYSTGLLEKVTMKGARYADAPSLECITYDAKGQRMGIRYGNGVQSKYTYNECTYELKQLRTTRNNGEALQDISYWYDADGNVCHIKDLTCPTVFCNGQQVDPDADYTYDSLYRLIKATGREHAGLWEQHQNENARLAQSVNDTNKLQNYTQFFKYDAGGNLLQEKHIAAQSSACRTRTMIADTGSNRVLSSTLGSCDNDDDDKTSEQYRFDANGNQQNLGSQLSKLNWNYRNNIQKVILVDRGDKAPDAEYYVYDGSGQRARKVTERYANQGSTLNIDETIYLGGFEIQLKKQQAGQNAPVVNSEWHTVRFEPAAAEWRYWIKGNIKEGAEKSQVRYQLENHLNSSVIELDREAKVISWEEYYPYGGTAVKAGEAEIETKRYRYSGKEKDANTGLYYYGMRYYCSWLCRWLSTDPAGTIDGLNLYAFVENNPVKHVDVEGMVKQIIVHGKKENAPKTHKDLNKQSKTLGQKIMGELKNNLLQNNKLTTDLFNKEQQIIQKKKSIGMSIQKDKNVIQAIKAGLLGDKKTFNTKWRDSDIAMDEHVSTSTVFNMLSGIGPLSNKQEEDLVIQAFKVVSHFRLPTNMTGYNTVDGSVQHPTSKSTEFFDTSGKDHGNWDRLRREDVLEIGINSTSKGVHRIIEMTLEGSLHTLNFGLSPSLANNVTSKKSKKDNLDQTKKREGIKDIGKILKPGIVVSRGRRRNNKWTAVRKRRAFSPPRTR